MADHNPANTSFGGTSILSRVTSFKNFKYAVVIQLLDDVQQISLQFRGNEQGQAVLDAVCHQLDIVEKDYFGLRYHDKCNYRFWLDLSKPLNRQFKGDHLCLSLRFRFYPRDPLTLRENVTRYQLFVQLRRDLLHGRLHCSPLQSVKLAALILQAVLGDYNEQTHPDGYVSGYQLILKQTERLEDMIAESHKDLQGLTEDEAQSRFLCIAAEVESYGYDPYVVKDSKQNSDLVIGSTCRGILVFSKNHLLRNIPWEQLAKVDYTGKELKIYPSRDYIDEATDPGNNLLNTTSSTVASNGSSKSRVSFRSGKTPKIVDGHKEKFKFICPSQVFAKHLWRHLLSQQAFYTEEVAKMVKPVFSKSRIPIFFRGSTFKLPSKKVLHEIEKESEVTSARADQPLYYTKYSLPKQISRADLDLSISSKTNTLRSVKIAEKPSVFIIDKHVSVVVERAEPIQEAVEQNKATSSTPRGSVANLAAFEYKPVYIETTADQLLKGPRFKNQQSTTSIQNTSDTTIGRNFAAGNYGNADEDGFVNNNYSSFPKPVPAMDYLHDVGIRSNGTNGTTNGHLNGSVNSRKDTNNAIALKKTVESNGIVRSVLSFTLLLTVLSVFVVASFEANDGGGLRWTRDFSAIASFRQVIYEPSKDYIEQIITRIRSE